MIEKVLVGWKAIAEFLDWTLSKTMKYSRELHREGVILRTLKGRPPNRRWVVFTFSDLLKLWALERFRSKRRFDNKIRIFIRFTYDDKEHGAVIEIKPENQNEKYIQDQGYQFIDAVIRTLRHKGRITSE